MLRRIAFCILFLCTTAFGYSEIPSDTCKGKIDSLLQLIKSISSSDPLLAKKNCLTGIRQSLQCGDSISLVKFKTWLGRSSTIMADYSNAFEQLIESQNIARKIGDTKGEAFSVLSQGNIFFYHKIYLEALPYYLNALKLAETCGDSDLIGSAYHNVGLTYFNGYHNYDSADFYLNKALKIFKANFDTAKIYFTFYSIGANYYERENYSSASFYLEEAIQLGRSYLGNTFYGDALITLGDIYIRQNKLFMAEENIVKGLELVKKTNMLYYVEKGYRNMSKLYVAKGNYRKAYEYAHMALVLKDSLEKQDLTNKIAVLKIKNDLDIKEQEIKLLTTEKSLTSVTLKKRKIVLNITILILVLLIIITILGINQYRIQKKFNETLQKQVDDKTHELQDALKRAEKSDELKSKFLQNMSHEVRTPINAIHGFSELLSEEPLIQVKYKDYTSTIIRNSNYLIELFDNITIISRLETNDYYFSFDNFQITAILETLAEKFRCRSIEKHNGVVDFKSSFEGLDENTLIFSDKDNLYRILYNILDNALKYTISGSIIFKAQKLLTSLLFTVSDTGIGIPAEFKNQIFEKFRKFNLLNDRYNRGAGLGLPIAKLIAEKLKAKIWFDSIPGSGSNFYLELPIKH
jgi:signal transduction histidine kinase